MKHQENLLLNESKSFDLSAFYLKDYRLAETHTGNGQSKAQDGRRAFKFLAALAKTSKALTLMRCRIEYVCYFRRKIGNLILSEA